MAKRIELKLYRSVIGTPRWMRAIVKTLALRKTNSTVVKNDSPSIRGMVAKVPHLVSIKELEN